MKKTRDNIPAGTLFRYTTDVGLTDKQAVVGDRIRLITDDLSDCPKFEVADGQDTEWSNGFYEYLSCLEQLEDGTTYPDNNPKQAAGAKKVPLQLVPPILTIEVAKVMKHGADKYGAFNFRESNIAATVYVGAILRHCLAIADGQDIDPESGESHWAHIAASCGIALDAKQCGTFVDDRPEKGTAAEVLEAYNERH